MKSLSVFAFVVFFLALGQVFHIGFLSNLASAQAQTEEPEGPFMLCRNKSIVRTIRVEKFDEEFFVTIYTRGGKDREIGRGRNKGSLVRILENVKGNLEGAGWTCREVEKIAITTSEKLSD